MKNILFLNTVQNKAWKNRALFLMLALVVSMSNAWGTYYSRAGVKVASASGSGTVYVKKGATTASASSYEKMTTGDSFVYTDVASSDKKNFSTNFAICAVPATDSRFDGWTLDGGWSTNPSVTSASTYGVVNGTSTFGGDRATTGTAAASFVQISIASVTPTTVTLTPTDARISCSDYTGSVVFTTTNDNAASQIGAPTFTKTGSGTWNATNYWAAGTSTVTYTFKGNGYYGGSGTSSGSRSNSATLTLPTAGGTSSKSVNFTANFPSLVLSDATENNKAYPINPTTNGTGTVVFPVQYCDGAFDFIATITGASGGTFTPGTISFTQINAATGSGNITVPFTFNAGGAEGDFSATLTLTPQANTGGTAKSVTITAYAEAEATDDAKVIAADGETLIYQGDWATAWTTANTAVNAGCKLVLLRNVGGLTAYQEVKNTFTLDLNGKVLSGKRSGTLIYLNTSGKTLTIKDSKTGGMVQHINNEYAGTPYCVNITKGSLVLESGTLYCENQGASGRKAGGVICKAGTTFTMNGGKIDVWGYNGAHGISQESNKNDNTTFTMNGGEIIALGYSDIYGITAAGKVNINDGTINVTATYSNCRGITLSAVSNATPANCYWGTLTMKGGTINSTCTANADGTRYAYGVYFDCANTAMGTATATDGSHANKAASTGTIENATINVSTLGRYAYGVFANGSYQSKTNHYDVIQIKNSIINTTAQYYYSYGVYANVGINGTHGGRYFGNIELTDCNITSKTTKYHTAYCVYANATSATVFKDVQPNYYGEYAVGAKVTINSGNYEATAGTTYAYAVASATRARTIYDSETSVYADRKLGGNAVAYPELIIHGGTFVGHALGVNSDRHARAVSSGGNTTIDGGTFRAVSEGRFARCIYGVAGKLNVTNATIDATANGRYTATNMASEATGVFGDVTIQTPTGFTEYCDITLNNCNISANTVRGNTAYGVYLNCTSRPFTELYLRLDSINNGWTHNDAGSGSYDLYKVIYPSGDRSVAAKATINGGTIKAKTDSLASAYGVYVAGPTFGHYGGSSAACELIAKNVTIEVNTETSSAYGIITAGPATIDNVTATIKAKTTTACGIQCNYGKTTITNTKLDVTAGTGSAFGYYGQVGISSNTSATTKVIPAGGPTVTIIPAYNYVQIRESEAELGVGNVFDVKTTTNNTAYGIFLNASKANWNTDAYNNAKGEYAYAAKATINGGKYTATAFGTTAYGIYLNAPTQQGSVYGRPRCTVTGGKFWGKATGGTDGAVNGSGVQDYFVLKGGVYNVNTNLSKYIPEGYEEFPLPNDRPEYTEGYRYAIEPVGMHGNYVCQIGSTKYKTLEEALQVVTSDQVIYMIANYTMTTPGDYVLPSGTTLLIPYKDGTGEGASTAIGNSAKTTTSATTPTLFRKLTLGEGVNLTCFGTIETSAQQKANGQYGANVGMPSGAYGQIHMEEGSHISLEADSRLNCWGYITGKGTINVKKNAAILEGFQMGDWCGGTNYGTLNENGEKVFPVTHYFYQSIECPVTYRPGSRAYGSSHLNVSYVGVVGQDDIALVGTSGSMFIMDDNDVSAETWVMKDYDEATDQCIWTINSGASLGNLTIEIYTYKMRSANYDLPITTNMSVVLNYGEMEVGQNSVFLPGSKLIVNKQGTAVLNGVTVTAYDAADWTVGTRYFATYSPTWGTTNPRKNIAVESAEFFLHGKVDIRNNGGLYTTPSGANIHSTNADAGEVIYTTAAQGDKTNYYLQQGTTTRTAVTTNPARLLNGDGSYTASAGTAKEKTWIYYDDQWQCWTQDEYCFYRDASNNPYAKPNGYVALNKQEADGDDASLIHDAATGTRGFIWDENCYWWEVVTTPTAEGYYKSLNADNNGNYNYYYYDSAADCWKIKKITVTWNVNGTNTKYSVGYGTKPEWLGATPTKSSSSVNYVWRWDGWTMGSDQTVLANNNLPFVTEDITFTAHFYEKYYEYNITFKNDDGTILESKNWIAGTTPSYEGTPTKNPTAEKSFEFNGTWTPAIATVSGPATYVAQYNATPRKYTIMFLNYDMSVLGTAEVPYGSKPTRATYLEAVAPLKDDPYKPDNSAYLFEFAGWRLYGASSNGFVGVAGDQMYIAQYNQTKKYLIQILDIVDADNTEKSLTINATSFALSGWSYTINGVEYARPADRMLTIPYGDKDPNEEIVIEVKDKEGTVVSCNKYIVPFVYTSDTTLSGTDENSIVFVKSGTLTVGDASAKEIYVAPGAALKVEENGTLDVKKLVLRTTPFEAAILTNKGTIVGQVYYSRIARDTDFHLFAIPAGSNTADVVLSDGTSAAVASTVAPYGNAWQLREYNTARRAEVGDDGANWNNIGWDSIVVNGNTRDTTYSDVAIKASKGYELRSGSKYYREYLFPVTLPTTATSVQVTDTTSEAGAVAGAAHAGWNILCSPYTDVYKVEYDPRDPTKGITVSWQQPDGSYTQVKPTVIPPAIPFAYQASKGEEKLYFAGSTIAAAPRKQSAAEALTETEWVHLDIFDAYGEGDETSLFVHPTRFEQTYKTGIDVAKQSLTASRPIIYSTHAYGDMAFAGVADSLLENGIDIAVYSPAAQELTFSLRENKFLNRLEYLWLADNETGTRTDLLMDDYTCRANAGTTKGRFVLNGRFKTPQIATGLGNTQTDYNIYAIGNNIAISGVEQGTPIYVFDAVGHMIYTTAATSDEVIVPAPCAGVYMLTIGGQTAKLVVNQ